MWSWLRPPIREYILIALLAMGLLTELVVPAIAPALFVIAAVAVIPTVWGALAALGRGRINIDTFNALAVVVAFVVRDVRSAAFIALMLSFARLLDWHTESRTKHAISRLLALKPTTALRLVNDREESVPVEKIRRGDLLLVKNGARVPVDGRVTFGSAEVNESSVTGESKPVDVAVGDTVLSGTMVETGAVKMIAERVGKDSTIERMVALMEAAAKHKSHAEKLADRFATIFLPIVAALGVIVFLLTRNLSMVAALFLVACADDMAVAIPLAMTASLGVAARRGVVVKGGEWLDTFGKMRVLVLDKTGTLTYGTMTVDDVHREGEMTDKTFWRLVGSAEKFSEHATGKALRDHARSIVEHLPDPEHFRALPGVGVQAKVEGHDVLAGNNKLLARFKLKAPSALLESAVLVFIDRAFVGAISVADSPRKEAAASLERLREVGVKRIVMFTGDRPETAKLVAKRLRITEVRAAMKPEDKVRELERLLPDGPVGMVGDGINDAPVLARADVGIAMGTGGAAVSVEAADAVILTDNLARLPEMVLLGRRTSRVIRRDMIIWVLTNIVGFALVLTGVFGPALAAFYNFATDFLPLANSSLLFRRKP